MKTFKVYMATYAGRSAEAKQGARIVEEQLSSISWPSDITMPAPRLPGDAVPNSLLLYHTTSGMRGAGIARKLSPVSPVPFSRIFLPNTIAPSGYIHEPPLALDILSAAKLLDAPCLMLGLNLVNLNAYWTSREAKEELGLAIESILHTYYIGRDYHKTPEEWIAESVSDMSNAMSRAALAHDELDPNAPPRECKLLTTISFEVKERRAA